VNVTDTMATMPLVVTNSFSRKREAFSPLNPERVRFYSCGPTVYDDAHIGNFRSFLAADILRRWIESPLCEIQFKSGAVHRGPRTVIQVMNITDVGHMTDDESADGSGEDKMAVAGRRLAEAKKAGMLPAGVSVDPTDPYAIAAFYTARFLEDARRLGLKVAIDAVADPTLMPRASAHVPGMISTIQRLIDRGHAYAVGEPGAQVVYFDVRSFPSYGRLSGNTLESLVAGKGGRVSEENQSAKRHPADFLLWKADPSHVMKWDSPWGAGYPGWHIECSVMSHERLVNSEGLCDDLMPGAEPLIDIHSGGEDNIFPHHECEIAQSCCAFNEDPDQGTFARLWFHPRFLLVEGEKMSKRKGTFITARQLFEQGHDPAAVRLELVKTHYRSNANFTEQGLHDSARMVERWRRMRLDLARRAVAWREHDTRLVSMHFNDAFARCMHDDLNVAGAIGHINSALNVYMSYDIDRAKLPDWSDAETEQMISQRDSFPITRQPIDVFEHVEPVLSVLQLERQHAIESEIGIFASGIDPDPDVVALLEARRDARTARDFARSDHIRDELAAMGYAIKDVPGGKVEVTRAR
jgi:cysteinyl-tRNA synthetase